MRFIDIREKWEGKRESAKKFSEKYKILLSFLYYLDIIISMKNNYREKKVLCQSCLEVFIPILQIKS